MPDHLHYKFSVTIHSDDRAIVRCLRALAEFCQKQGEKNIPWAGADEKDWERDGHVVTFRFSTTRYRDGFLAEAKRLLPRALWHVMATSDDDPESPQQ
jgi:hypothetical protein